MRPVALILVFAFAVSAAAARTLTFDDRVAAQGAIEEVYWKHRIWPADSCPAVADGDQTDTDGDGVGDACQVP